MNQFLKNVAEFLEGLNRKKHSIGRYGPYKQCQIYWLSKKLSLALIKL